MEPGDVMAERAAAEDDRTDECSNCGVFIDAGEAEEFRGLCEGCHWSEHREWLRDTGRAA